MRADPVDVRSRASRMHRAEKFVALPAIWLRRGVTTSREGRVEMKRSIKAMVGIIVLTLTLTLPASAGATVKWVCFVPGVGDVTFVSVPDAALHGITQANLKAGETFRNQFGEECRVV